MQTATVVETHMSDRAVVTMTRTSSLRESPNSGSTRINNNTYKQNSPLAKSKRCHSNDKLASTITPSDAIQPVVHQRGSSLRLAGRTATLPSAVPNRYDFKYVESTSRDSQDHSLGANGTTSSSVKDPYNGTASFSSSAVAAGISSSNTSLNSQVCNTSNSNNNNGNNNNNNSTCSSAASNTRLSKFKTRSQQPCMHGPLVADYRIPAASVSTSCCSYTSNCTNGTTNCGSAVSTTTSSSISSSSGLPNPSPHTAASRPPLGVAKRSSLSDQEDTGNGIGGAYSSSVAIGTNNEHKKVPAPKPPRSPTRGLCNKFYNDDNSSNEDLLPEYRSDCEEPVIVSTPSATPSINTRVPIDNNNNNSSSVSSRSSLRKNSNSPINSQSNDPNLPPTQSVVGVGRNSPSPTKSVKWNLKGTEVLNIPRNQSSNSRNRSQKTSRPGKGLRRDSENLDYNTVQKLHDNYIEKSTELLKNQVSVLEISRNGDINFNNYRKQLIENLDIQKKILDEFLYRLKPSSVSSGISTASAASASAAVPPTPTGHVQNNEHQNK